MTLTIYPDAWIARSGDFCGDRQTETNYCCTQCTLSLLKHFKLNFCDQDGYNVVGTIDCNITEEIVCKMLLILYNIVAILFICLQVGDTLLQNPARATKMVRINYCKCFSDDKLVYWETVGLVFPHSHIIYLCYILCTCVLERSTNY